VHLAFSFCKVERTKVMQERYTIQEYADKMQVNASTVYRWVKQGKLSTEKVNGVSHIIIGDANMQEEVAKMQNDSGLIAELRERIRYLEAENAKKNQQIDNQNMLIQQMQQDAADAQQRSDTIILQFSRQFEEQTKLLEDMREKGELEKSSFLRRLFFREKVKDPNKNAVN